MTLHLKPVLSTLGFSKQCQLYLNLAANEHDNEFQECLKFFYKFMKNQI